LRFYLELIEFLAFLGDFHQHTHMVGDIIIDIAFRNMEEVELSTEVHQIPLWSNVDYTWHRATLRFLTSASATELLSGDRRSDLCERIMNRFGQCFGYWDLGEHFRRALEARQQDS
jgi:hypothetical protein